MHKLEDYLDNLLAAITDENRHPEVDWGPAVGKEIIDDDYSKEPCITPNQ